MRSPLLKVMRLFTAGLCLLAAGCASSLTASAPPVSTVVEGEKRLGETAGLQFDVHQDPWTRELTLTQTPMCREMVGREKVSRKQLHGVLPAIIEIGFFGLGIIDLAAAHAIVNNSEMRTPMDDAPTGLQRPCAPVQPAADRQVILQYGGVGTLTYARSDAAGIIRSEASPPSGEFAYVNVFVRTGTAKRFAGVAWLTAPTP